MINQVQLKKVISVNIVKDYFKDLKSDLRNNKGYKHIPNLLTFIRFLAPFFIIPLFLFDKFNVALIIVILAAITDIFDGLLARKFDATSEFGKLLDAVTDKFFTLSLMVPIIKINGFYSILIITEIIIALTNYIAFKKNKNPESHYVGKFKTVIEFAFLSLCYLSYVVNIDINIINITFIINMILELLTIFIYVKKNL